jgi:hypothetical protein
MLFQCNISLLLVNGGLSAHGVHRCRARRSGIEGYDRSGGEGRGGSVRWRWLQRARDAVEREEGWQLRLGAVEMSASGAEVQWRERHGGEHGRGGGAAKRGRGALSWRCSETSFF